jgi:hypothetical protein
MNIWKVTIILCLVTFMAGTALTVGMHMAPSDPDHSSIYISGCEGFIEGYGDSLGNEYVNWHVEQCPEDQFAVNQK